MNESQAVKCVLFELNMEPELAALSLGRLDFENLQNMPIEDAREEIEYNVAERVVIEETSLKLNPLLGEAGIHLTPEQTQEVTEKMYENAVEYPLSQLLSNYTELATLGASSSTFLNAVELSNELIASGAF